MTRDPGYQANDPAARAGRWLAVALVFFVTVGVGLGVLAFGVWVLRWAGLG